MLLVWALFFFLYICCTSQRKLSNITNKQKLSTAKGYHYKKLKGVSFMKKRLVSGFLSLCMILSLAIPAGAVSPENQNTVNPENYTEISRNEYLNNYAEYYNITYDEALAINQAENKQIWEDYAERNNIPVTCGIIYDGHDPIEGATLHYVTVYNTYSTAVVDVTYKAFGKIISDPQSYTFVPGSFGEGRAETNNAFFSIKDDYRVIVNNNSYTRLTLTLDCTVEIAANLIGQAGFEIAAVEAVFGASVNGYYRKSIHDSFTETLP